MRLLWGSRLNASTRMNALLALGMLLATAFGVVLVGLVNQGFSEILSDEVKLMEDSPDGQLYMGSIAPPQSPQSRQSDARIKEMKADILASVSQGSPASWRYRSVALLTVPVENLGAMQSMWADFKQNYPEEIEPGATRAERDIFRAKRRAVVDQMSAMRERLSISMMMACAGEGEVGPQAKDEVWVKRTWGQEGPVVGQTIVALLNDMGGVGSANQLPLHRKFKTVRQAPEEMRSLGCTLWVPASFIDVVERRHPREVSHVVAWRGDYPTQAFVDKWYTKEQPNGALMKSGEQVIGNSLLRSEDYKESIRTDLIAAQKLRAIQQMISWCIVSIVGALAIYQVCSLMMMLGLHFRFDVAVLRSMGMARWRVMMVFLVSSVVLMSAGVGTGLWLGWEFLPHMNNFIAWIAGRFGVADRMEQLPWAANPDFLWIALVSGVGLGVIAGLLPAWMASRTHPADIWKSES